MDRDRWRDERRAAYEAHAAALDRRRAAETAQAKALLAEFVREMKAGGVPAVRLRARVPDTGTTYRTDVTGWYLRRNRSLGAGVDGGYYILDTAPNLGARVFGLRLEPSDPPLVVGVGARDGESIPLQQLLRLRADAGERWE